MSVGLAECLYMHVVDWLHVEYFHPILIVISDAAFANEAKAQLHKGNIISSSNWFRTSD